MRDWLSAICATAGIVFILGGVNGDNPHQGLYLISAIVMIGASTLLKGKK